MMRPGLNDSADVDDEANVAVSREHTKTTVSLFVDSLKGNDRTYFMVATVLLSILSYFRLHHPQV